jgi:hypothetical protein
MHCQFHRGGESLAGLIARKKQTLAVLFAAVMKLGLLGVWFVEP